MISIAAASFSIGPLRFAGWPVTRLLADQIKQPVRRVDHALVGVLDLVAAVWIFRIDAWRRNHHAAVTADIDADTKLTGAVPDGAASRLSEIEVTRSGRASCRSGLRPVTAMVGAKLVERLLAVNYKIRVTFFGIHFDNKEAVRSSSRQTNVGVRPLGANVF